jgi:hypothetical protein
MPSIEHVLIARYGDRGLAAVAALAAACSVFIALPAHAQVRAVQAYKCTDDRGRVTYTDRLCEHAVEPSLVDSRFGSSPRASAAAPARHDPDMLLTAGRDALPRPAALTVPLRRCADAQRDYEISVGENRKDVTKMNERWRQATLACGATLEMHPDHVRLAQASRKTASHRGHTPLPPTVN